MPFAVEPATVETTSWRAEQSPAPTGGCQYRASFIRVWRWSVLFGGTHRARPTDGCRGRVPYAPPGWWAVPGWGGQGRPPLRGVLMPCVIHAAVVGVSVLRAARRGRRALRGKRCRLPFGRRRVSIAAGLAGHIGPALRRVGTVAEGGALLVCPKNVGLLCEKCIYSLRRRGMKFFQVFVAFTVKYDILIMYRSVRKFAAPVHGFPQGGHPTFAVFTT